MSSPCRNGIAIALAGVVLASLSCGGSAPSPEKRTFRGAEGRFSYVVPPNWVVWMGEARSPNGSLFSVEAVSLQDSMQEFILGLPETMVTLVREQTHRFFGVVGNGASEKVTVDGIATLKVTFPVQVRAGDPQSEVTFWIARHGDYCFVLRISYPAGFVAADSPAVDDIIASWKFGPVPTPDPDATTSKLYPTAPTPRPAT